MDIRDTVQRLCRKYQTRDPYELADALGIILISAPLSRSVRGFYQLSNRIKIIYLNNSFPEETRRIVLAHELGHAVMHDRVNSFFLDKHTFLITDRFEIEANRFAADLLISDEDVENYKELTIDQLRLLTGFEEDAVRYRFQDKSKSPLH